MDVSRQNCGEANNTGVSMYLSFDSSISSAAYKTLEASTNELSILSNMNDNDETEENSQELHQNSTLEAKNSHLNYLDSVKDMDMDKPSAVPKRILQEFNVVSSTPTKEQLLRSVEIFRGSSAERCVDLELVFMDVDEKKENDHVTDKENALPLEYVAGLSDNKIEEATIITEDQVSSVVEDKTKNKDDNEITNTKDEKSPIVKDSRKAAALESKVPAINKRLSVAKKHICEPDLLTNRPSRIAINANKRFSIHNIASKSHIEKEISMEIPKLMNKVLKFAEATSVVNDKAKTCAALDKRKLISDNSKGRCSMLSSNAKLPAEKRPFAFTQRMSVLVKTTLNSPARKIARRSVLPIGQQNWKGVAPTVPLKATRKSMLPVGKSTQPSTATTNTQAVSTTLTDSLKSLPANRKSIYPTDNSRSNTQKKTATFTSLPALNTKTRVSMTGNTDTSLVCSVCGSKFRIKSLLDAHKRSHEGDELPAFVKKSTASVTNTASSAQSQPSGVNKCKYCDKQFTLIRTLHIHLLQNCSKIPPNEKRKLKFHEMDHVEKAQLPTFFHASRVNGKSNSQAQMKYSASESAQRSHSDLSSISVSSTDSTSEKKAIADITMIANTAAAVVDGLLPEMAPPTRMVKKTTAHAGVYRTPNKPILCHICKISFKCIMDHMQHNMTAHFKRGEILSGSDSVGK